MEENGDKEVDNLRDWLLVSHLQLGGEPWAEILISKETEIGIIEIAKAKGIKCDRCWHFETDIGMNHEHPKICSRCFNIIQRL